MAKRLKIGLIYSYNEKWIAGTYYIENLIKALKLVEDEDKPELIIYSNPADYQRIVEIQYPYIKFRNISLRYTFFERAINVLSRRLFKKNFFEKRPNNKDLDFLFPAFHTKNWLLGALEEERKIYWIPDFQEHYYPNFFSKEEIKYRKQVQEDITKSAKKVVFSSCSALRDFQKFYPQHNPKTYVLNFAVTHPNYDNQNIDLIRAKYNLPKDYFLSPNQFWVHKNHIVVLKAIKILKESGNNYFVAFSGKQEDYRNPGYFQSLEEYVKENDLEENIRFLGFIDRAEQLALMKHAKAIIQPSLFEGWSTVIEDAKAMSQWVIASDLEVHREQIKENVLFFNSHNESDLSEKIQYFIERKPQKKHINYENNIKKFAYDFIEIIS